MNRVYVKKWFCQKIEAEKGEKIFSNCAEVLKESEKAVFVKFVESHSYRAKSGIVESWVPKSCLHSEEEAAIFEENIKKALKAHNAVLA